MLQGSLRVAVVRGSYPPCRKPSVALLWVIRSSRGGCFGHAFQTKPFMLSGRPMEHDRGREFRVLQTADRYRHGILQPFCPHENDRPARGAECLLQPLPRRAGSAPGSGLAFQADKGGVGVDRPIRERRSGTSLALQATARIDASRLSGEDKLHAPARAGRGSSRLAAMHSLVPGSGAASRFETGAREMRNHLPCARAKAPVERSYPWRAA